METIRVNMTPCEDVETIHASQNDNEAREWGFELHNNGEKIDSSSISDQLVFKAYEGGTEEILPTNGSTPTTSPFKGDIKYPQGLLSDQEFLYRQSPTEEDGLAKIQTIYGNTLKWNQLVQNGNFADGTNHWSGSMGTSVANNICTLTANSTSVSLNFNQTLSLKSNHKYLIKFDIMPSLNTSIMYNLYDGTDFNITKEFNATANAWYNYAEIVQPTNDIIQFYIRPNRTGTQGSTYRLKNVNIIDLTQMGLDITDPSEFTSLFSLPYYAYNQGTLLSFSGNGIRTTGKNLLKTNIATETINGVTFTVNKNENGELTEIVVSGTATQRANFYILPQGTNNVLSTGRYILSCGFGSQNIYMSSYNTSTGLSYRDYGSGIEVPYVTGEDYSIYISVLTGATANNIIFKPMLRLADVEDATFEPYTSSTLSLPISTYFSNGMKSAGSVYDELTESKAITRIGSVDLGSLTWQYLGNNAFLTTVNGLKPPTSNGDIINAKSSKYSIATYNTLSGDVSLVCLSGYIGTNRIYVRDTSYTDATAFKQAMTDQNVKLYYEIETPTETSFTTASLVTENAEIPLSAENDVLIGKCTEELSAEPGFHDAKIKLADADGECYSNKIQLHVERSPQ